EFDRIFAAAHRQANAKAFAIDQIGLRGEANQMQLVAAEQDFRGQKRPIGRSHDEDLVGSRHDAPPKLQKRRWSPAHWRGWVGPPMMKKDAIGPAKAMQCIMPGGGAAPMASGS